jgi:hypothetical protein
MVNKVRPIHASGTPSDRGACDWAERPPEGNIIGDTLVFADRGYQTYVWKGTAQGWVSPYYLPGGAGFVDPNTGDPTPIFRAPFPKSVGSATNKAVFSAAVAANVAKVAYVGHSIAAGNNQNFLGATVYNMLRSIMKEAFPNVAFTFENYGIGGTKAADFLGNPNVTIAASSNNVYRENWQNDSGAITSAASWANKVAAFAPDIMFVQYDLNEIDANVFAAAIQAIIDDVAGNGRWTAKRPTIVLISSHTGKANGPSTPAVIRNCHKALRALARKNKVALIDGGRIYDVLTTGIDPVNLIPSVTGETAWLNSLTSASVLSSALYESKIGTAFSPTGTTVRDQASGSNLRAYRTVLSQDGANQQEVTTNSAATVISIFYRADPLDANYANGTGVQYEVRITGTAVQAYYWSAGSAVAISGAVVTLTNGAGSSTKFMLRAEYKGANHKVTVVAPTGEVKSFEFVDYQRMDAGYNGFGYSGSSGGFFAQGTLGNTSSGQVLEYWTPPTIGYISHTESAILGPVSDFTTNVASVGGNAINHPSNAGYKAVYEHSMYDCMRQLQA